MASSLDLEAYKPLLHLLQAVGLGALIGLERERHRGEQQVLAGIRTFPIVSLSGALAAHLALATALPTLISVGALTAGGFALAMYWVRQRLGTTGMTSPVALFATYFIGVLVGYDLTLQAIVAAVAVTVLLFTKERLHNLAKVLTPKEMEGALYFIVIAFVLYPLTPERPIGPWNLFNPRQFLLVVILVSVLSFLSFLALRKWGTGRGFLYTGLLGGLVNSEAVTASLAHHVRRLARLETAARGGILLATSTMFVRNVAIAAIADPSLRLVAPVTAPLLGSCLVLGLWTLGTPQRAGPAEPKVVLESPFALRPAFTFAAWFALLSILTLALTRVPGIHPNVVLAASVGGFVSAGAVVASMGALVATGQTPVELAATTAVLASLVSALGKLLIARAAGTPPLALRLALPILSALAVGGGLLWFQTVI